ncbi:MAG TPA: TVP38/TMEM64 family protein [Chloroflexota bacterium]|nr:TVP38/TMEM64 family protein [Chloroflexota bacterium]
MTASPPELEQPDLDRPPAKRTGGRWRAILWPLAAVVALLYFLSSLVVVLNSIGNATGVVWLPSFPSWYYGLTRLLYWPFGWYFAVLGPLQADPRVSYSTYALISRAPFLLIPPVIWALALIRGRRARGGGERGGARSSPWVRSGPWLWLVSLVGLAVVAILAVPAWREALGAGLATLDPRASDRLRDYLRSFGPWAPAVSFLLMVAQSVVAPLPAPVITIANGYLFGAFWGGLLSWTSAMAGAGLCFGLARALGRPVVGRLAGDGPLAKTDAFFVRYGTSAVLIARLIPIVSFDAISYAAGLTRMGLASFLIATGVGQIPATVVYSVLGENITSGSRAALWAAGGLLSLLVLGLTVRSRLDRQGNATGRRTAGLGVASGE